MLNVKLQYLCSLNQEIFRLENIKAQMQKNKDYEKRDAFRKDLNWCKEEREKIIKENVYRVTAHCKLWDAGEKGLTLSAFEWEKDRKTLIYGQVDYMYGEALYKPEMKEGNPIRLYSLDEITEIFCKLGLRICNSFADFSGKPSSDNDIQLMVYSIRE